MAKKISSLSVSLGASVAPFTSAFKGARSSVTGLVGSLASAGRSVLKFTGIAGGIGAVFGALKGAAKGISLAAELEQVGVAFETMLGSGNAAKKLMGELTTFSAATPFEFPEIARSAKQLLAFGVGADDMTNKLTMLGDISAGVGKPLEEMAAIYGKIKSRGQLTGQTLNQLAQAGVPIYKALAKQLGVAESEVAAMVSTGKAGFPQVDAALKGLTAEGGQFAGLMKKQSTTLAGLWSTLTDNIGLTMAGMVTAMVDAFSLRDALSSLTGGIGNIGGMLTAGVARWAPIIVGWVKGAWSVITTGWKAIRDFLAPIITGIVDFIARNWQQNVATVTGYLFALRSAVGSVLNVVWGIVKTVAEGVVSVWTWGMGLLGIETAQTGSTIGNVFQSIASIGRWLMDQITYALNVISYSVTNWRDTFELAAAEVALFIVRTGNQIAHVFTDVIPGLLTWFADNWRDVFMTLASFTSATFVNMAKNVGSFFTALWGAIKGEGFNFEWTPLTEGFENTIKELPKIAERQLGPLEQAMQDHAEGLRSSFAGGLAAHLAEQEKAVKGTTDAIASAVSGFDNLLNAPTIEAPEIPEVDVKVNADTSALDAVAAKAKKTNSEMKAIFAGSAEAQRARFQASFAARVQPASPANPIPPNGAKIQGETKEQTKVLEKLLASDQEGNDLLADILDKEGADFEAADF